MSCGVEISESFTGTMESAGDLNMPKIEMSGGGKSSQPTRPFMVGGGRDAREAVTNHVERLAVKLLTSRTPSAVKRFIAENMGKSAQKKEKQLLQFMRAIPDKKAEYGVFGISPLRAKLFVLAEGKMKHSFLKRAATHRRERVGVVADVTVSARTGKITKLGLNFEFLTPQKLAEVRRLQRGSGIIKQKVQGGGGYYLAVGEPSIGKVAPVNSYMHCCPPVFKGNLIGGGVIQELAEPLTSILTPNLYALQGVREGVTHLQNHLNKNKKKQSGGGAPDIVGAPCGPVYGPVTPQQNLCGDTMLRQFGCTQPDWGPACI